MTPSTSLSSSNSARGPDTITASVPFGAADAAVTGLSICTMLRFANRS
jgi:hypothetical protein